MKKILAITMALLLAVSMAGLAEDSIAELRDIKKAAQDAVESIKAPEPPVTPEPGEPTPSPTPDATIYEELQNGSRGDAVQKLQAKLAALGYLKGSADGIFGNMTAEAVKSFQEMNSLPATGIADSETQRTLYAISTSAAAVVVYDALKYDATKPGGAQFEGHNVEFSGTVMQVLTDDTYADTAGNYIVMRVATRGKCYDVVYVYGFRDKDAAAIAEGDTVTVRGVTHGHIVYMSISGGYVDVPRVEFETLNGK